MTCNRTLLLVCICTLASQSAVVAAQGERVLFDFADPDAATQWMNVNDGVMGGVSTGEFGITDQDTMEFYGKLSLENNGGFTSVRSKPQSLGLSDNDSIAVRVRGDGREYTLNLYIPTSRTAFSYRASIQTEKGEWMEARLPISDFHATSFGRRVENADPVDATKVNSLGFLLGDKKAGPFKLEVAWIKVVGSSPEQQKPVRTELPQPPTGKDWKLVWSDEFNGKELNRQKWDVPSNRRRDGWWSPQAVSLDNKGNLVISTLREGDRYLDACVRTRDKFEHAHGYYVARIKLHDQPGHWCAFWLYNSSVGKVGNAGRDGTEIDIMEKPWLDNRVQHALHWDGYGDAHRSKGKVSTVPGVMDGFHTFALWWKHDEYIFYVDGKETWRTDAGGVCQVPLYIKLSDEIGKWAGDITEAELPDRFLVDYVRVYDLVDSE
ncbi:MAG: CIA30 family protein [Planctomycetota bacterium]